MKKYCISREYTILETIEAINASKNRVVIVLDKDEKIVGVISQGDIIRALIAGKSLYSGITTLLRPSFFYLSERNMEAAYDLFKRNRITLLPVVDEDFHVTSLIDMDDIFNYMEEK